MLQTDLGEMMSYTGIAIYIQASPCNYIIGISNATYTLSDHWCINNYILYDIQPTGPACRLATQQVGYDQKGKSAVQRRRLQQHRLQQHTQYHFLDGATWV